MKRYKRYEEIEDSIIGKVFTKFKNPITEGKVLECHENARIEFLARYKKGENVKYCSGQLTADIEHRTRYSTMKGKRIDDSGPLFHPIYHSFVILDDLYVIDSTPFIFEVDKNWNESLVELAPKHFKNPKYLVEYVENDISKLKKKIKFRK